MKYIKTYEIYKKPENEYWKVKTNNPWFEISLDKIGMTEDEKEEYLNDVSISNFYLNQDKEIFIELSYYINNAGIGSRYYWSEDENDFNNEYKLDKPIFRGEPKITSKDIEEWKLKNDVKKYNL